MTKTSALASIIALIAVTAASPLIAKEPTVVTGRINAETVSFADLDLREHSAQQQLHGRVQAAAERVCVKAYGRFEQRISGLSMEPSCARHTYRNARPQIAATIDRAKAGTLAVNSLTIVAR